MATTVLGPQLEGKQKFLYAGPIMFNLRTCKQVWALNVLTQTLLQFRTSTGLMLTGNPNSAPERTSGGPIVPKQTILLTFC